MTKLKFNTGIMEMALRKSDKEAQAKDAHVGGLQSVQVPQMDKKDKNLNGALGGFRPQPV